MNQFKSVLIRSLVIAFVCVGLLQRFAKAEQNPLPPFSLDDLVSIHKLHQVLISPDGAWIAFMVEEPNREDQSGLPFRRSLHLIPARGGEQREVTLYQPGGSSLQWSPKSNMMTFLASRPDVKGRQVFGVTPEDLSIHQLTQTELAMNSFSWSLDESKIACLVTAPQDSEQQRQRELGFDAIDVSPGGPDQLSAKQNLWILDPADNKSHPVDLGPLHVVSHAISPTGSRVAVAVSDSTTAGDSYLRPRLLTAALPGGAPRVLDDRAAGVTHPVWSPDGRWLAYQGCSKQAYEPFPVALYLTRGHDDEPKDLVAGRDFIVDSFDWLGNTGELLIMATSGADRYLARLSPDTGRMKRLTPKSHVLAFRSSYSVSHDGLRIACVLTRGDQPPDVWFIETETGLARKLTDLNPHLHERLYGPVEEVFWHAPDSLKISGVLCKPVNYDPAQRYPLIVQLHGSQVADVTEFQASWMNWGVLLAAHGYAVLLPNYRGSLTSGADFFRGNLGDFGGKDFDDIMAGVDAMIDRGIADPERLGIGGVSYGGYLTSWAITQTDRFKAAVMGLGISNWISIAGQTGIYEIHAESYWTFAPYDRLDFVWERSPIKYSAQVKTPTLIYAGQNDGAVPPSQSREFLRALSHFGVPSKFYLYPREGHGLHEPNHVRHNMQTILDWFDEHLKCP
jgi:dipeptidyl aminopeptidase/acylaminoacyl peptidase